MFFGLIKTKKDKRIIELEEENIKLKEMVSIQIQPQIVYEQYGTEDLHSVFTVYFDDVERISQEEILNILCKRLCEELKKNIEIVTEDDYMRRQKIFHGRIRICTKKQR